jgi:hypothetical protein
MRQLDVAWFQWVRWFWGLTSDFWAENGRKKIKETAKEMKSVVSAFGLTPALRQRLGQSGVALCGWFGRWAEAQL